jgi:hypothetical protein
VTAPPALRDTGPSCRRQGVRSRAAALHCGHGAALEGTSFLLKRPTSYYGANLGCTPILLTGPEALLVYWQSATGHSCDGITQSDDRLCACPGTLPERRAAAKQGRAC